MKIAVLGTGMVGQNISQSLAAKGHSVMIGTRDAAKALATTELSPYGMPAFGVWHKEHGELTVSSFAEAISFGDIVINATNGIVSLDALKQGRAETAGDKILIDVEMMMAIWLRLWGVIGNTPFNFKVVRQPKL
jgi:8-hydroxy-5-deazaflavin:NADPH oxidoreductase